MTKKIIFIFLVIIIFVVIIAKTHKISIIKIGSAKVVNSKKNIVFVFEDFFHPELQKLRKQEKLDKLVGDSKTEFEKILKLKDWTNKQWEQSNPYPYPPFNANVILKQIRAKKTGGWCGQYGVVFAHACMSFGIPARYFETMPAGEGGHFVVEVYSKDYKKWILMDPTINIYYERNSIPLNVMELHELRYHNKKNDAYSVSDSSKTIADLDYFFSFACMLRNNHLSMPLKVVVEKNVIRLIDRRMLYYDRCITDLKRKEMESKSQVVSSDIKDFYWEPDIVVIKVLKKTQRKKTVFLEFSGLYKDYQKFLVSYDYRKNWHTTGAKFAWHLNSGLNMLEVTAPDKNGLKKRYSYIIARLGN